MRIRSEYSFRYAYGKLENVHKRVLELGWGAAPLSDRLSTFGFTKWNDLCTKINIKPIFGVEIGTTWQFGESRPSTSYWTFFAINKLRTINELVYKATSKIGHYPVLTYDEAISVDDAIIIADNKVALSWVARNENFYIALSPSIPIGLFREGKENGYNFIASSDNVFTIDNDKLPYYVLLGKDSDTASYPRYIQTNEEWRASLPYCVTDEDAEMAIKNRQIAIEKCKAQLLKADVFKPKYDEDLITICMEGADELGIDVKYSPYKERFQREINLIYEKKFEDYFYIVSDLVKFAKKHMIVGPARGSAAGSLVCYLSGITSVDPIKFDLLFERFIDPSRPDLPDIDLDFSDSKRYLVFDYLKEKYGINHVARLGSVIRYKSKSILNRAGASLGIPKWLCDNVADTLIERSSADSRLMQTFKESFSDTEVGRRLVNEYSEISTVYDAENHATNAGQHAAGIAITSGEVLDYVAIDGRTGAIMADKDDAEKLNILKIDILGLSQLSVFERCLELMGQKPKNGFLESLPLDDQSAFDLLNKKHFSGIFQANGKSLQILFQSIHTDKFFDLVSITSLSRPGPVASGGAVRWTRKRMGTERTTFKHPLLEPYLNNTYGEMIFQEQIMAIARDIGKMDFKDINMIRKAMSKSLGTEVLKKYKESFAKGARQYNMSEEMIDTLWGEVSQFGAWAFNLSHAVSYSLITYYCCWLKAHYPVEFAAATLDHEYEPLKQLKLLRELHLEGVKYKAIDPNHSTGLWNIKENEETGEKTLIGPLTNIKGIGPVSVKKILEARRKNEPLTPSLMAKLQTAKTSIDSLTPIWDAINKLHPSFEDSKIYTLPTPMDQLEAGMEGMFAVFGLVKRIQPRDENDAHSVAKRGGVRIEGQSWSLNLFMHDDSDEILCKIQRWDYLRIGKIIEEIGGQGDSLYAIKGTIPRTFRMILITGIKYLGKLSDLEKKKEMKSDLFGGYIQIAAQ